MYIYIVYIIYILDCELKCMSNKPTGKVIYTANQNILIPLRKVLPICYNGSDLHSNCK